MYKVFADNLCIYDDTSQSPSENLIGPKLSLADNTAGSFSMTLTPENVGYDYIKRMTTDILITKDGRDYWTGRVLSEKKDFWNNRTLTCEGALAYLNDSIQPPKGYYGTTIRMYLLQMLSYHNNAMSNPKRMINLGRVTVTTGEGEDSYHGSTNYDSTIDCINDLLKRFGGHIFIRIEDNGLYLDYLKNYDNTNTQTIEFGKNLLDFTKNWNSSNLATVVIPLGAKIQNDNPDAPDQYVTVETVNSGDPRVYDSNSEALSIYGKIEKVVMFDKIEDPAILYLMARLYLQDSQFDDMCLEVKALDLRYMNANYEAIDLNDGLHVISKPHGLDRWFPVQKLDIPLDKPEDTIFSLNYDSRTPYTKITNTQNSSLNNKIDNIEIPKVDVSGILQSAKDNAAQLIEAATNGYITITTYVNENNVKTQELYITNTPEIENATRCWRWNINGLGYGTRENSNQPWNYSTAITMDGSIVADFVTTGTMSANRIRGGTLESQNGNLNFNLNNGSIAFSDPVYNSKGLSIKSQNVIMDHTGYWYLSRYYDYDTSRTYELPIQIGSAFVGTGDEAYVNGSGISWYYPVAAGSTFNSPPPYRMWKFFYNHSNDVQGLGEINLRDEYYNNSIIRLTGQGDLLIDCRVFSVGHSKTPQIYLTADDILLDGNVRIVNGQKNRLVKTDDYGDRLLYCYETTSPYFGDIGSGVISNDGILNVQLDPVFIQTVNTDSYVVFLQACGEGQCYVNDTFKTYFIVKGTPGLKIFWEVKAKQSDFDQKRIESYEYDRTLPQSNTINYDKDASNHIKVINEGRIPNIERGDTK